MGTSTTGSPTSPLALLLSELASSGLLCPKFSVADSAGKSECLLTSHIKLLPLFPPKPKESGYVFGRTSWGRHTSVQLQ